MKYAIFSEQGLPQAFYSKDIHGNNIPKEAIPITDEQWLEFINNQRQRAWINNQIIDISNKKWDNTNKQWVEITEQEKVNEMKPQVISYYDNYNRKIIEKHYPLLKLQGFMQLSISLQLQLNDPNLTDDQKQAIQNKLNLTNAVNDWINQCTGLYYTYEQKFEQATTIDEINQYKQEIEQAYAQLEGKDPKITYKQLAG